MKLLNYLCAAVFYILLVHFNLIEKHWTNFAILLLIVLVVDLYDFFKKTKNINDKPDVDNLSPSPVSPPDNPNPPDLSSVQFNEFIRKSREKEKVPRE